MKILLFSALFALSACELPIPDENKGKWPQDEYINYTSVGHTQGCNFYKIIIDSCDYIYGIPKYREGRFLTHAGNCKNPVHKR